MRKLLEAVLAAPVIAAIVAGAVLARVGKRRVVAAFGAFAVAGIVLVTISRPTPSEARPPSHYHAMAPDVFSAEVQTGLGATVPLTMTFEEPMDRASVAAVLRVEPATAVDLSWDVAGTVITVSPRTTWAPGVLSTITVDAGALEAGGRPIVRPVRLSFGVRAATTARIVVTDVVGKEVAIDTAFRLVFDRPVDDSTLEVLIDPAVDGAIEPDPDAPKGGAAYRFIPGDPLDPATTYHLTLGPGLVDAVGSPVASTSLDVTTGSVPAVVRFRPRAGWKDVTRDQVLSVRFTKPMDHASTQAAWKATAAGKPVAGTFSWTEGDTVLVFKPKAAFGYGQTVVMTVGAGARSLAGLPLQGKASATFATVKAPVAPKPTPTPTSGGSGGSVGAGTWAGVESYYFKLMNCTRTGGWVTSTGACSNTGYAGAPPLIYDSGIASKVSRPYAKYLAVNNLCSHYINGTPGDRLAAAGYTSHYWAENLGCRSGDPYAAVLASHLFFQSEKSYNGGHYRNIMSPTSDRAGVGVWVYSGRVRLCIDFYHP